LLAKLQKRFVTLQPKQQKAYENRNYSCNGQGAAPVAAGLQEQ
jgi:hypothetical protein